MCETASRCQGITLSQRQLAIAREEAMEAGLADRVDFSLRDYRHQDGCFDRVVSIGMLEHVGPRNYRDYFDKIACLLAEDGVAVVHTIAIHGKAAPVNRWMTKYIFPGGYLPSIEQLVHATDQAAPEDHRYGSLARPLCRNAKALAPSVSGKPAGHRRPL